MRDTFRPSLISLYKKISIGWATVGLILTATLALTCFFYLSKQSAETKIETLAQSVTRAFRPTILDRNIRDAQLQMNRVLNLKDSEHVLIRDADFKTIYSSDGEEVISACKSSQKVCWNSIFSEMTYLQPVYFNDDVKEGLFGYVELKVSHKFNWPLAAWFGLVLTAIFFLSSFSLYKFQSRSVRHISKTVNLWADRLKKNPSLRSSVNEAPFSEFLPLESAISELYQEIDRLKENAAEEAKLKTQLSMLKEINHDLKTPLSQLAKFFSVHISKTRRTGILDEETVEYMERSLKTVGNLIRQIGTSRPLTVVENALPSFSDIAEETRTFIKDSLKVDEFSNQKNSIEISTCASALAKIPSSEFYRILDNLLKNSLDAIDPDTGKILVTVGVENNLPTLIVEDNGCGISKANIKNIFESGYTTKLSDGNGLGLSSVRGICGKFKADISVESVVGIGSMFQVSFLPYLDQDFEHLSDLKEVSL